MDDKMLQMYRDIHAAHMGILKALLEQKQVALQCGDLQTLADLGYVLREVEKLSKEINVQVKELATLVARVFSVIWSADPNATDKVQTEWCSAYPNNKVHCEMPKPKTDPEGYEKILKALGFSQEMINTGLVRIGYDEFSDYCTKLANEGRPLPIEGMPSWTEWRLSIRERQKLGCAINPDESREVSGDVSTGEF